MPFKPGQSGNLNGRPRVPEIELFRKALAEVEATKKTTLLNHAVERAFKDDGVLIALLKKMLPDKLETKIDYPDEVKDELRATLRAYWTGKILKGEQVGDQVKANEGVNASVN